MRVGVTANPQCVQRISPRSGAGVLDQLSGGQQWRVAIARAHALKAEILPLDEVTSALEAELVGEALDTIRHLASDGLTVLIVSHKLGVREVSSKVTIMDGSRPVEEGLPAQIFGAARTGRARVVGKILRR